MKKTILFVTYRDEDCGEGFSYAIDLAKTMDRGMAVLMINRKSIMQRFEDVMTSVAFAEAGEHETAKKIFAQGMKNDSLEKKVMSFGERCRGAGVEMSEQSGAKNILKAVAYYISAKNSVDMILLSPNVSADGNITEKDLQNLFKKVSRPIVTMTRQASSMCQA